MLVDLRIYKVRPGMVGTQLDNYEKYGFPTQVKYCGEPIAYLSAESGDLNTLVHLWAFENAGDRETRRAAMMKDPDWHVYLRKNVETGYIVDQRTSLMVPAKFAPIRR